MKFSIHNARMISENCASVRVDVGIASFDVTVVDMGNRFQVNKPIGVFIPDYQDWKLIIGAVIGEYKNVSIMENVSNERETTIYQKG